MKRIGILGGIGPQATMDLEARLHRVAQRCVPQHANTGYPPLTTVYMRHPPVRVHDDGTPVRPLVLDERLLRAAEQLGSSVDLLVIPSNTPHLFLPEIAAAAGCEVLSLIDAALEALRDGDAGPVGLLGLGVPEAYADRLAARGRAILTADEPARRALDAAIIRMMEGADGDADRAAAQRALEQVRAAGAGQTILGCTEIPLLLGPEADAEDLINPAELLAQEAIRRAVE